VIDISIDTLILQQPSYEKYIQPVVSLQLL